MRKYRIISLLLLCVIHIQLDAQLPVIPKEKREAIANPKLSADSSVLRFDTYHIHADRLNEDDSPVSYNYRFTNSGDKVLHIKRLVTTCSCASAFCEEEYIKPGAESNIKVIYNPKGHPGKFERRIFVYTQEGNCPSAVLKLSVEVESGSDVSFQFPCQMGKIRTTRSEVTFSKGRKGVERIPFINMTGIPMTLKCDRNMMPACLSFATEPETVAAGQEGEIVISYMPGEGVEYKRMLVVLKGLGLPPSKSSIEVFLNEFNY